MSSTKSRKDERAVVSLVARYRSPATFEYVQEACCDVSVGGMFIKSQNPAAAGTLLKLECEADESEKIRGVGRVVWLRREPNEHGPAGMGVKFVKLEPGSKELITELVKRLADAGIEPRNISAPPETAAARRAPEIVQPASSPGSIASAAVRSSIPSATRSPAPTALGASAIRSSAPATATMRSPQPGIGRTPQPGASAPSNGSGAPSPESSASATHQAPQPVAPSKLDDASAANPRPGRALDAPAESGDAHREHSSAVSSAARPGATLAASAEADVPETIAEGQKAAAPRVPSVISVPPPPVRRSPMRIWLGIAAAVAVLVAIIFADDTTGSTPAPAAPAAMSGAAEPAAPEPPSAPPVPPPATAEPSPGDSPSPATAPASTAAEPPPTQPEPAEQPVIPPPPAAAPQATIPQATTGQPSTTTTVSPAAAKGGFVMEFLSRPTGATITVGDRTVVTPGQLEFGSDMPPRVKVIAKKPGFQQSSAWIDHTGFENINGALVRRVTMILPAEAVAPPPAAPAHPH